MPTKLCATPYDITASQFYFDSYEEYEKKFDLAYEEHDTEEYEIQFMDGEGLELFKALNVCQSTIEEFYTMLEDYESFDNDQLIAFEWLTAYQGLPALDAFDKVDDVQVYEGDKSDYAYELIQQCYDIKEMGSLANYIDYDSFARDMELNSEICDMDNGYIIVNCLDF